MKTSTLSNIIKICAILFMVAMFLFTKKPVDDIIKVASVIVAFWLPIDVNKTIKNIRTKENEET